MLTPSSLPLSRTRGQRFDELVVAAVEQLDNDWGEQLQPLQVAVEDVPDLLTPDDEYSAQVVSDRGVALARLRGTAAAPVLVIYRRPVEARSEAGDDRADLVLSLVVELLAEWLGRDVDEVDPR